MTAHETSSAFGATLQRYRSARRMSQLDLATLCDVSSRHVSFLESGRAQPSRDMVMRLGEGLLLPLGARNALLHAAGYAAAFPVSPLDSAAVEPFRAILDEMIARHAPYPALVVDRHWTVREANPAARRILAPLQADTGEMNVVRLLTAGAHVGRFIDNLGEVLSETRARMRLEALESGGDDELVDLLTRLDRCCAEHQLSEPRVRRPVLPLVVNSDAGQLRLLSAIAHFGTSEDAAVRDLRLELFFPADDDTRIAFAKAV